MIDLTAVYKLVWDKLSELSCNIYDYIPYGELDFPYAYIGGLYTRDRSIKNADAIGCELYVNIISAYRGRTELLGLMNEVNSLMKQDMSNEEYTIFVRQKRHTTMKEKDEVGWGKNDNNVFYHAVLIFDIEVHKKIL